MFSQCLANYVLALNDSLEGTHYAEDRSCYKNLLAEAAVLLALAIHGTELATLAKRMDQHERLWGQVFLVGPGHRIVAAHWQRVKMSQ